MSSAEDNLRHLARARKPSPPYTAGKWLDENFGDGDSLKEHYARLLSDDGLALAKRIVALEAEGRADDYLGWCFDGGIAAIDAILSNQLRAGDIVVASRHLGGQSARLLHSFYAERFGIAVERFGDDEAAEFRTFLEAVKSRYASRLAEGARLRVFVESPCALSGQVLDVAEICTAAHESRAVVILGASAGNPFLSRPFLAARSVQRPDFVVRCYRSASSERPGEALGVVIGKKERMFLPKGHSFDGVEWSDTLFWGEFCIKGAFLGQERVAKANEALRTLELETRQRAINTIVLAGALEAHPGVKVHGGALGSALPAPIFCFDFERARIPAYAFARFLEKLLRTGKGLSAIGRGDIDTSETRVSSPVLGHHGVLDPAVGAERASIKPTTLRIEVGLESPAKVMAGFEDALRFTVDRDCPAFSRRFLSEVEIDELYCRTFVDVHRRLGFGGIGSAGANELN